MSGYRHWYSVWSVGTQVTISFLSSGPILARTSEPCALPWKSLTWLLAPQAEPGHEEVPVFRMALPLALFHAVGWTFDHPGRAQP